MIPEFFTSFFKDVSIIAKEVLSPGANNVLPESESISRVGVRVLMSTVMGGALVNGVTILAGASVTLAGTVLKLAIYVSFYALAHDVLIRASSRENEDQYKQHLYLPGLQPVYDKLLQMLTWTSVKKQDSEIEKEDNTSEFVLDAAQTVKANK